MKDYDKKIKKDKNDYLPYDEEEYFEKETNKTVKTRKTYTYKKTFNKENPYY